MHRGPSRPRRYCRTAAARANASCDAHGPLGFARMEGGIYVTFFEPGEPFERELPPVGPLDHVVVRPGRLIADRRAGHAHDAEHDVVKTLHAEIELQRALGIEPGEPKRSQMRITAPDGVFLRRASLDAPGRVGPELGPFAVVVIGKRGIEADGQIVASEDGDPPDVAFRSTTTAYHPRVAPDASAERPPVPRRIMADEPRPAPETVPEESASRPSPRRQIEVYSPPGSHGAILKPEARTPR